MVDNIQFRLGIYYRELNWILFKIGNGDATPVQKARIKQLQRFIQETKHGSKVNESEGS